MIKTKFKAVEVRRFGTTLCEGDEFYLLPYKGAEEYDEERTGFLCFFIKRFGKNVAESPIEFLLGQNQLAPRLAGGTRYNEGASALFAGGGEAFKFDRIVNSEPIFLRAKKLVSAQRNPYDRELQRYKDGNESFSFFMLEQIPTPKSVVEKIGTPKEWHDKYIESLE